LSDSDGPLPGFHPPSYEQAAYPAYQQAPYPGMPGVGAAPPMRRPGAVNLALWLILLGAAVVLAMFVSAVLIGGADLEQSARESLAQDGPYTESDVRSLKTFLIAMFSALLAVPMALFVVFGFVMRTGRNWARVTLTVLLSIGLVVALGLALAPAYLAVRLLAVVMFPLNIAAIVAMFQAGPYFDPRARMGGWTT
jgi:ABC-type Fe3+ transport system permease subunit